MLFLTHLYLAKAVEAQYNIENLDEYYLGTILPDIRYFTGVPRSATHLSIKKINLLMAGKKLKDVSRGIKVHLAIDEMAHEGAVYREAKQNFPIILQKIINTQLLNIIFDLYALQHFKTQPKITLSSQYFDEFASLSIAQTQLLDYTSKINSILEGLEISQVEKVILSTNRLKQNKKVAVYRILGKIMFSFPWLKNYLIATALPSFITFENELKKNITL